MTSSIYLTKDVWNLLHNGPTAILASWLLFAMYVCMYRLEYEQLDISSSKQ
jgi:hypothetical protein